MHTHFNIQVLLIAFLVAGAILLFLHYFWGALWPGFRCTLLVVLSVVFFFNLRYWLFYAGLACANWNINGLIKSGVPPQVAAAETWPWALIGWNVGLWGSILLAIFTLGYIVHCYWGDNGSTVD